MYARRKKETSYVVYRLTQLSCTPSFTRRYFFIFLFFYSPAGALIIYKIYNKI